MGKGPVTFALGVTYVFVELSEEVGTARSMVPDEGVLMVGTGLATLIVGVETTFGVGTAMDGTGTFLAPTFLTRLENFSWSNHEGDVVIVLFGTE